MSDTETLEEFIRRYDILVGVVGGLTASDKQVAAIRGVLKENERKDVDEEYFTAAIERLRAALCEANAKSTERFKYAAGLEQENGRLRSALEVPKEYIVVSKRIWEARAKAIDAALSLTESLQITHPYIAVRLRHALKGEK